MSKNKHVEAVVHEVHAPQAAAAPAAAPVAAVADVAVPAAVAAVAAPADVAAPAAPAAPAVPAAAAASVVSTLYGVGVIWAQKGIGLGKTALESLARALDRTAKRLGDLQIQLNHDAEKPAA